MYWRINLVLLVLILASCRGKETRIVVEEAALPEVSRSYKNPLALIEASELMALAGDNHIKIIDFRQRADFETGHIPGAVQMWRSDIEAVESEVPGMMASRKSMEELLSGLGITNEDTLVIYDDQACVNAARLWWVLHVYGFDKVRLLNGGLQSWELADAPLTLQSEENTPGKFEFAGPGNASLRIESDSVQAALRRPGQVLLDVRTTDEYSGKRQKAESRAAGRIPGSLHIDWADAVYYNGNRKFRAVEELERIYNKIPEDRNTPIITYCHSGVRSAHSTFVLTQLLGYRQVQNYDGSWLEWSSLEGAPVEKDSLTTILN